MSVDKPPRRALRQGATAPEAPTRRATISTIVQAPWRPATLSNATYQPDDMKQKSTLPTALLTLFAIPAQASSPAAAPGAPLDLTATGFGIAALVVFIISYSLVIAEEFLHLRKSKPVIVGAGIIWILIGIFYAMHGGGEIVHNAAKHMILEFAELMLFLLAAMTFINTMGERGIFNALRAKLLSAGFSLRTIFWLTGLLAFCISPVADNLTTALVMAAVVIAIGGENRPFIVVSCINIVIAANAGGAFSPFGDITTLMVWQSGQVKFSEFFDLLIPSLVNWLVPALLMSLSVPRTAPERGTGASSAEVKYGGYMVVVLFLATIVLTVVMHSSLHLPPAMGMMTGMGLLALFGYRLRRHELNRIDAMTPAMENIQISPEVMKQLLDHYKPRRRPFDIFISMKRAEWDTLMFFYGVVLAVGGLGTIGYLALASQLMYVDLGPTGANILVGVLSSIVDNIPVMYAVLTMNPEMSHGQWLLVTLTAGVGGSLLSIGSAAGVALMGQARGIYTFFAHLKWSWAIALGYAASIWSHFLINGELFQIFH